MEKRINITYIHSGQKSFLLHKSPAVHNEVKQYQWQKRIEFREWMLVSQNQRIIVMEGTLRASSSPTHCNANLQLLALSAPCCNQLRYPVGLGTCCFSFAILIQNTSWFAYVCLCVREERCVTGAYWDWKSRRQRDQHLFSLYYKSLWDGEKP